jgi:alpha-L-fucosidase 2
MSQRVVLGFLKFLSIILILISYSSCQKDERPPISKYDLKFSKLATSWDEAIPLGNGMIGALVWEKDNKLRFSLDRADLWDLRPMENLDKPEWKFSWVKEQWEKNTYEKVQEMFDAPYDQNPAPSKIPGAALEFDLASFGEVESVELHLAEALCEVKWVNGVTLLTFIEAENTIGWFQFKGLKHFISSGIMPPAYNLEGESGANNPVTGQDLRRLCYPKGKIVKQENSITYEQEGWGGFRYQVSVRWQQKKDVLEGCWSIHSEFPGWEKQVSAEEQTLHALINGFSVQFEKHKKWWANFWSQSDISIPDSVLNRQWHLEMYKLGAITGNGAPPISLQAVWTADNGKLPPWKGDFHNDLNTQLSYWPVYSSNHLEQERGFIDWLEKNKPQFEKYTQQYFEAPGINVPGVSTLTGQPMGGWIQYSFGPTVSAWLGQYFYLQWRYSMDREFLEKEAYPWFKGVATYLEAFTTIGEKGYRTLPLSSSPEIFDNSRQAWFPDMTNFDLALVRWTFEKAAELAAELGIQQDAARWNALLSQCPDFDIDPESGFTFAKGVPYSESHRHFSHLMAFHPLGLVDWSKGEKDQEIIKSTLATLDKYGPDWWCGYSYSWLGNLKACAFDGEGAAEALRTFARCFCLPNSFHVNGDQSGTGKSKFTYRPFTLEGNFAFAAGVQEMLIQSHTGTVVLFPAIPKDWKDVNFSKLRAEGAFLVSAKMENGVVTEVIILSEKGGELKLLNPFRNGKFYCSVSYTQSSNTLLFLTKAMQIIKMHQ